MIRYLTAFVIGSICMAVLVVNLDFFNQSPAKEIGAEITSIEELIDIVVSEEELECLAKTIYFEARGSTLAGKLAVGLVVINRANSKEFPNTICKVVTQGKVSKTSVPCQFNWYCDGKSDIPTDKKEWEECLKVANIILTQNVFDFTDGATSFHNGTVKPKFNGLKKVAQIDGHTFYKKR